MRMQLAALALVLIASAATAQPQPDPKPAIDAVGKLAFLEGTWNGAGWLQMGPGPRDEFNQTEIVRSTVDGAVMTIEGIGYAGDNEGKKIHHAFGVIAYDPKSSELTFSSFMAGRPRLDTTPEVDGNTMTWGFSPPAGGNVRYTIVVEGDTWHETGEWSADGETWQQFFEMTLKKE